MPSKYKDIDLDKVNQLLDELERYLGEDEENNEEHQQAEIRKKAEQFIEAVRKNLETAIDRGVAFISMTSSSPPPQTALIYSSDVVYSIIGEDDEITERVKEAVLSSIRNFLDKLTNIKVGGNGLELNIKGLEKLGKVGIILNDGKLIYYNSFGLASTVIYVDFNKILKKSPNEAFKILLDLVKVMRQNLHIILRTKYAESLPPAIALDVMDAIRDEELSNMLELLMADISNRVIYDSLIIKLISYIAMAIKSGEYIDPKKLSLEDLARLIIPESAIKNNKKIYTSMYM